MRWMGRLLFPSDLNKPEWPPHPHGRVSTATSPDCASLQFKQKAAPAAVRTGGVREETSSETGVYKANLTGRIRYCKKNDGNQARVILCNDGPGKPTSRNPERLTSQLGRVIMHMLDNFHFTMLIILGCLSFSPFSR